MRRALVLTDETARHPFLASLPPHVRRGTAPHAFREAPAPKRRWLDPNDYRDVAVTWAAGFLATTIYFA